jgi:hypothetical protein
VVLEKEECSRWSAADPTWQFRLDETRHPEHPSPGQERKTRCGVVSSSLQIQSLLGPKQIKTLCEVEKIFPIGKGSSRRWVTLLRQHHPNTTDTYVCLSPSISLRPPHLPLKSMVTSKALLVTAPAYITETLLDSSPAHQSLSLPLGPMDDDHSSSSALERLRGTLSKIYYPPIAGVWTTYPDHAFKVYCSPITTCSSPQPSTGQARWIWSSHPKEHKDPNSWEHLGLHALQS